MKHLFTLTLLLTIIKLSYSQDIIYKKNGSDIEAKIIEIGISEIKYHKFDNITGPIYVIPKSEVFFIKYENGSKEIFNEVTKNVTSETKASNEDMYPKGINDANINYRGYKPAGTGTLVVSLLSPIVGLIPAIACSATRPSEFNLNYPNADLMKNTDYRNGYERTAKSIKSKKVWTNWGIGLGVNILAAIILYSGAR